MAVPTMPAPTTATRPSLLLMTSPSLGRRLVWSSNENAEAKGESWFVARACLLCRTTASPIQDWLHCAPELALLCGRQFSERCAAYADRRALQFATVLDLL